MLWAVGAVIISSVLVSAILTLIYGQFAWGFGGALWVILGIVIMKYFFRATHRAQFESFKAGLAALVSGFDFDQHPA